MLYWIQILSPIGGATSMDFFTKQIACLIAGKNRNLPTEICPTVVNRMVLLTTQVDLCTRSDSSARYGKDPTEITRHFF